MQSEQYSNLSVLEGSKNSLLEKVIATEKDTSVYEALVAFNKTYERAIEEIIAEDNLITENNDEEMYSIPSSNSNLKVILEDNKIIESDTTEEVHYLDFKIINAASNKESTIEFDIITFDKKALKS